MIIDASVAFKWIVEETDSYTAISWIGRTELRAPYLVHAEVGNALSKRIRNGEISSDSGASDKLRDLGRLLTVVDDTQFMPHALDLSIKLDHSIYDCVYLAMAESMSDPLLTADVRFVAKVIADNPDAPIILLGSSQ